MRRTTMPGKARSSSKSRWGPLPFEAGSFDCVTSVELLEHLTEAEGLAHLAEAHRVLRPGGRLLLTTPNYGSLWPLLEWVVNRLGEVSYKDQHITHYTRRRLAEAVAAAGFGEVDCKAFQFMAPFAAALGWRLADRIQAWEPAFLVEATGLPLDRLREEEPMTPRPGGDRSDLPGARERAGRGRGPGGGVGGSGMGG